MLSRVFKTSSFVSIIFSIQPAKSSIVIILQENTVGPQTIGTVEIHLPYAEFSAYMKEEYFPSALKGVASFQKNQEIFLTLPGIAEEVPMMLVSELQEEKMYQSLWLGQNELPLEEHLMLEDAFIVRTEKDVYCLLEADMGSDDYVTYVYRVTNGVLEKVNEVYAAIDAANINTHEIKMESWVFLLGTYGGVKNYHFDEILKNYDIVITGEGRLDSQSLNGKVISGIMGYNPKKLEFVVGQNALEENIGYVVHAIVPTVATTEDALNNPKESLEKLIKEVYR